MKITKALLSIAIPFAVLSFSANAELSHTDWKVAGDQRATLSEETGLEWLKLSNTSNMSMNTVISLLDTEFSGWRLPTNDEVEVFFSDVLGPLNFNDEATPLLTGSEYRGYALAWEEWMSIGYLDGDNVTRSYGLHTDDNGSVVMTGTRTSSTSPSFTIIFDEWVHSDFSYEMKNSAYSVFLVSDGGTTLSSIENPSLNANNAAALVNNVPVALVGLLPFFGLFAARRRKSHLTKLAK